MNFIQELLLKEYKEELFALLLKGSSVGGEKDFWSDTDLLVIMDEGRPVDKRLRDSVLKVATIIGEELIEDEDHIVYRWVLKYMGSVQLFDVQMIDFSYYKNNRLVDLGAYEVVYQKNASNLNEATSKDRSYTEHINEEQINSIWFRFYETTKKVCRKDNLIGLHLLLDLVREYLVLDMMKRDADKQTHIHRYGEFEQLPGNIDVDLIHTKDTGKLLDYINRLAKTFDNRLMLIDEGYWSRYDIFKEYIEESKGQL